MEIETSQGTFRSYLFFWCGQLISLLGSSIAQFVIIWWITIETESALVLSIASFLGLTPMVVLGLFTGVLVDRWNRKVLIGIMDFLQASATVGLIFLFWFDIVTIHYVFILLTLRGILQAFHSPAVAAITPSMVPKDKLSRMNGLNFLFIGAVNLIGPVVAALLLSFWEIYQILWIDALTFIVALMPLLLIMIPFVRKKQERSSFMDDFIKGFDFIRIAKGLLPLLILATSLNFLLTPFSTLLPYYVKFEHFGEASDLALIMAFFQGGMLAGGLFMSITKGFKRKMVVTAFSVYVIFLGYALVALTPTGLFWFMAVGGLIAALFVPVANVSTMTIIQTGVPLDLQGRVNSVVMALASAATPVGMILSGAIVEFTRPSTFFLGCAVSGVLILTFFWLFTDIKHVEKLGENQSGIHPNAT